MLKKLYPPNFRYDPIYTSGEHGQGLTLISFLEISTPAKTSATTATIADPI